MTHSANADSNAGTDGDFALADFRAEVREWLQANCPPEMRRKMTGAEEQPWGGRRFRWTEPQRRWLDAMVSRGWTVPEWSTEYGGAGLSTDEARVLSEEMDRIDARVPVQGFGIWYLGPILLKYGSEEQKRRFLPPIARGEIRWCQGYSEPGAGSDLASLNTRCEDRGDHWLVNGSKIWTSMADAADWIFCLVRTDFDVTKHKGVSFLLFDMESAGVSTKPIRLISGQSEFCETFFDDVEVPKDQLVGQPGIGWQIAKDLLDHEREAIGGREHFSIGSGGNRFLGQLAVEKVGLEHGILADGDLRSLIARYEIDMLAVQHFTRRLADEATAGKAMGAQASALKFLSTETNKRRQELAMSIAGADGLLAENAGTAQTWLRSRGNSIEGGTSEIQLNIIAKRVLGLP